MKSFWMMSKTVQEINKSTAKAWHKPTRRCFIFFYPLEGTYNASVVHGQEKEKEK
jgi:hypothetical protein